MKSKSLFLILVFICSCNFSSVVNNKLLKARTALSEQNYDQALELYEELLKLELTDSTRTRILVQLAEIYSLQKSKPDVSYTMFYNAEKIAPEGSEDFLLAKEGRAVIDFEFFRNYESALSNFIYLRDYKPTLPKFAYYRYMVAITYLKMKRYQEAESRFQEILDIGVDDYLTSTFYQMGIISFEQLRYKKAIEYWNEYLKREYRKENIVQTKFMMGNAYETMGELKLAYNLYFTIQDDYPNTKTLKERMSAIYNRKVSQKR